MDKFIALTEQTPQEEVEIDGKKTDKLYAKKILFGITLTIQEIITLLLPEMLRLI